VEIVHASPAPGGSKIEIDLQALVDQPSQLPRLGISSLPFRLDQLPLVELQVPAIVEVVLPVVVTGLHLIVVEAQLLASVEMSTVTAEPH